MGCHTEMRNEDIWEKVSTPGRLNNEQHIKHMNDVLKAYSNQNGKSMPKGEKNSLEQ